MTEAVTEERIQNEGDDTGDVQDVKLLSFGLGKDVYAFNIMGIKEIIEYGSVTRVPMVPGFIKGVINLRGSVVPVIDLAVRLGKSVINVTKRSCIVIFEIAHEDERIDIGVAIDAVNNVMSISEDEVELAPSFGAGIPAAFISGMVKVNSKFVIVLNLDKVLSIEELALLDRYAGRDERLDEVGER